MKEKLSLMIKILNGLMAIGACVLIFMSSLFLNNDEEYLISKVSHISLILVGVVLTLHIIDWLFIDPEVAKKYDR